ncbi:hypothetical protein [Paenibacillus sp. PL2-23]|uniref:hypothetical protein n=1 Tax=Paenibacillus sp. PL2-23 TaxID=2100729 RepID=UPI0030F4D728
MKQRALKVLTAAVIVTAGVWVGMAMAKPLEAGSAIAPGTIEDPVVTKSYVDEQIAKLSNGGTAGGSTGGSTGGTAGGTGEASGLEIVELPVGKTLMIAAGGEAVVRVGKAVAYSSDTNGISDLTGGIDIKSGKDVPTNHLIWFPRDGRGIMGHPDETGPLTLMVKGTYTIK